VLRARHAKSRDLLPARDQADRVHNTLYNRLFKSRVHVKHCCVKVPER
jgi:hypothetical protein